METRTILSRAPTRIDLAGGTVDIWPLYLFLRAPTTINLAIDLFAEAKLQSGSIQTLSEKTAGVVLRAEDQGRELSLSWDEVLQSSETPSSVPPELELHFKLLRHFARLRAAKSQLDPASQLALSTSARSPAGAGLGGSSALSVAMIGALAQWTHGSVDFLSEGASYIDITRDVETTVIQVPAGLQDYYGAMFGGLQSLSWREGSHSRSWLPETLIQETRSRLLLFYSGQSRNSGINNWALFKDFIDRGSNIRERFQSITDATRALEKALLARDWRGASRAIAAEWQVRHTLAPGISTPEMDRAFALAREIAFQGGEKELSGKVCGAGGGGCFFFFVPSGDPALMNRIREQVTSLGIRPLDFNAVPHGLKVRELNAELLGASRAELGVELGEEGPG